MKKLLAALVLCFYACVAFADTEIFCDLKGKCLNYRDMISAEKTVLFFWTSHCPYCMKEFININQNPQLFEGINVYFINLGEDKLSVALLAKHLKLSERITGKILLDDQVILAEKFSIIGVPTYVFLVNGKIVRRSYYVDKKLIAGAFGQ